MSSRGGAAVVARGLVKRYEDGRVVAVDGIDLDIAPGAFVAICGPSGCGKSTLLNLLASIDRPDAGTLEIAGQLLNGLGPRALDEYRLTTVGLVFQFHNLLPNLTAAENVIAAMLPTARPRRARLARTQDLLARVGLTDRAHARPRALSGGERQRIAIARALANEPRLLLADEPTGALDSANGERLLELLAAVQADLGTTLVVVTHDADVARHAGRVLHMRDGRIIKDGPPATR